MSILTSNVEAFGIRMRSPVLLSHFFLEFQYRKFYFLKRKGSAGLILCLMESNDSQLLENSLKVA